MVSSHHGSDAPVLVTGATGFIGSHLVERLVAEGRRVRCLVRRSSSLAWLPVGAVELSYGELAHDVGLREAVAGVGTVFHLAGVTKALVPAQYYAGNVQGTAHLLRALEACGLPGVRFVHVSSLAAAGPSPDGAPVNETAPPRPLSHYGRSKLEAEQVLERSAVAANAVIVRPPVVYGPRDTDVLRIFRAARRGWLPRIENREAFVSIIHVQDLVEGLFAAACSAQLGARVYFVANAEPVSWSQFAALVAGGTGRRLKAVPVPWPAAWVAGLAAEVCSRVRRQPSIISRDKVREARHRFWICDPSRACRELGFAAKKSLREGVAETLEWYKMVGWLKP